MKDSMTSSSIANNTNSRSESPYDLDSIKQMTQDVLRMAKQAGASSAETEVSFGTGQNVSVRMGETETIEYNRDKGISVTVYFGYQKGHASTSDLSVQALQDTVAAACNIARYTAKDEFCGLADTVLMAKELPDCDLYHPWDLSVDEAIEIAKTCETAARDVDKRITNSEGASVSISEGVFAYANSHGFVGGYATSRHGISCSVIAEGKDGDMQRDYWYTSARSALDLDSAASVGVTAGERTVRRLGSRAIKTAQVPVIFDASLASGLISSLISAVSGGNLYRKSSFLLDSLGTQIASPLLNIYEDAHLLRGVASSPFDSEGVATQSRQLIENGVLQGYVLSSYSARKLGMQTTGNAGGSHNLIVQPAGIPTDLSFAGLLKMMGTGLLVTEVLGHGLNMVTGDYSRGAAGFWVENGVIAYPVEEITIAGNLGDMLKQIVAIGNDSLKHSSKKVGSILIEHMTVAAGD